MPLVSVITPLYNKADYIAATIESVRAQTVSDWEMIVVDNGSSDNGAAVAKNIADARIQVTESPKRGPGAARNFGFRKAIGEWVMFLDADDLIEPDHLAALMNVSASRPDADIVVGGWREFADGQPDAVVHQRPMGEGEPPEVLRTSAIVAPPWAIHAALVRRRVILEDLMWPEELDTVSGEDVVFWFRLVLETSVAYCDAVGALYRVNTPNCRGQSLVPRNRVREFDLAAEYNAAYLAATGQSLTAGHCEMFVRVYSDLFGYAERVGLRDVSAAARGRAETWLKRYFERCATPSVAMRMRRWLGIPLARRVTALRQRISS